jgi:hypothetical protein
MLVINNGTVVTMDDARSVHFGGHVVYFERNLRIVTAVSGVPLA